jgi:mRNA interferase MazF
MRRGTIVLTHFPFTDLSSSKRRPAVVVSKYSEHKSDFIVSFISSIITDGLSETDLVFDINREDFQDSGLKKKSVIKLGKLATLNSGIFAGELGFINIKTLKEIDLRLKLALDLNH